MRCSYATLAGSAANETISAMMDVVYGVDPTESAIFTTDKHRIINVSSTPNPSKKDRSL